MIASAIRPPASEVQLNYEAINTEQSNGNIE